MDRLYEPRNDFPQDVILIVRGRRALWYRRKLSHLRLFL